MSSTARTIGDEIEHAPNSRRFKCPCGRVCVWFRDEFWYECPDCGQLHTRRRGGWTAP